MNERGRPGDRETGHSSIGHGFDTDTRCVATEAAYETMFNAVEDAVFLVDVSRANGNLTFIFQRTNPAHEASTGMTTDEFRGKTPREVLGTEDGAKVVARYRDCVERRETIEYEETLDHPSGTVEWHTKLTPLIDDGTVTKLVGIARDVTERSRRERELERYRRFIEASSDITTVVGPDGTIRYESPAVQDMLGYEPDALVGENAFEYVHPDDIDNARQTFIEGILEAPEAVHTHELRFRNAEGEWNWLELRAAVELDNPAIEGILINITDITDRVEYRQQLEAQRDNLELLNHVVRHDIRNDLQLVQTYTELLGDHVDDDGQEYLTTVLERVTSTVELTTTARELADVLLQSDTENQQIPLAQVLERQVEEVRSAYTEAVVTVEGDVPRVAIVGNDMLGSVFRNLLKNAIQHNDKDRPELTVSADERDDSVVVRIADNGPGIPDEQRETLFRKGEKGFESTGSGLGLYLVQTLVEQYGGNIWVEENDPEGTVFVIELCVAG